MRTTLTLDPKVAAKAGKAATKLGKPMINAALLVGLEHLLKSRAAKRYRTKPRPMGLRQGLSYDNIAELITRDESWDNQ
jgi:hypothetical protein